MLLSPALSLGGMESGKLLHNAHFGKFESTLVLDPRSEPTRCSRDPATSLTTTKAITGIKGYFVQTNPLYLSATGVAEDCSLG